MKEVFLEKLMVSKKAGKFFAFDRTVGILLFS
jgi:hypothetical protein